MNKTLDYYNILSKEYFKTTVNADMSNNYSHFIKLLKKESYILDAGCGSGRDIKYFMEQGYNVEGIDGSSELCKLAREYCDNENIRCVNFLEYNVKDKYDGIWACASLLHLSSKELEIVLKRLINACKDNAYIYASFKYGEYEGIRDNRYYIDMNEDRILQFISRYNDISLYELWLSKDVLKGRGEQVWINVILKVEKL